MTASLPSLADSLIQALHQPGQERLLDLVRNPLRLTLLCITWDRTLPETQAQLYENYLKKFYDWNQNLQELRGCAERCQTNITALKNQLNQQLGELAKAALDLPEERFRLSQSLVEKYLGEELDDKSLCYLALQLGWLNRVGKDNRGQFIFAFYHATFQEYFAALAVDNWDDFLPQNHVNFPVEGKKYRIFEPQWKQVILLWLGRGDVADEEKEGFVRKLVEFRDGCGDFYYYFANFSAADYLQYICLCDLNNLIIKKINQWSLEDGIEQRLGGITYYPYTYLAKDFLLKIEKTKFTRKDIPIVIDNPKEQEILNFIEKLNKIHKSDIRLLNFIDSYRNSFEGMSFLCFVFIYILDDKIKTEFNRLNLEKSIKEIILDPASFFVTYLFKGLHRLICDKDSGLQELKKILEQYEQYKIESQSLFEQINVVNKINEYTIAMIDIIERSLVLDDSAKKRLHKQILQLKSANNLNNILRILWEILDIANIYKEGWIIMKNIDILFEFGSDNKRLIDIALEFFIESYDSPIANPMASATLVNIIKIETSAKVTEILRQNIDFYDKNNYDEKPNLGLFSIFWHCAANLPYPDFYRAWHGLTETQTSPLIQTLNLAQLPQLLQTQITETNLYQTLQLLCIDGSEFDNPDNPATDIYLQLVKKHHCPKSTEGTPRILAELKIYWQLLDWEKHPIFIFYEEAKPQGFSQTFFDFLDRFDATICAIADSPHPTIPTFSPQDPHLIQTIMNWLQRTILEA